MNQSNEIEQEYHGRCLQCKQTKQLTPTYWCQDCRSEVSEQKYGRCTECGQINTGDKWCHPCNSKRFQQDFDNWTSGNDNIDEFIQGVQLSARNEYQLLEWMPYNRFKGIKYIAEGGFGKVYRANWKGYIVCWDTNKHRWVRYGQNKFTALKSLNNSQDVKFKFLNEVMLHHKIIEVKASHSIIRCYGITQDPDTKNYIMIMHYATKGNLREYLHYREKYNRKKMKRTKFRKDYFEDLEFKNNWKDKIRVLQFIAAGLYQIHRKKLVHRDLHVGNVVCFINSICITDMGMCKPADYDELRNAKSNIYGVLSYIAPEIFRGQHHTQASDIYSFGIIMYEVISRLPPYHNIDHDETLAVKIGNGLRPEFDIKVPELILHLFERCLDADPLNRPRAKEISRIFYEWLNDMNNSQSELVKQIEEAGKTSKNSSSSYSYTIHPGAIYTSRLLKFDNISKSDCLDCGLKDTNNGQSEEEKINKNSSSNHSETIYTSRLLKFNNDLPESANSEDYYEQYDSSISKSDCLDCEVAD